MGLPASARQGVAFAARAALPLAGLAFAFAGPGGGAFPFSPTALLTAAPAVAAEVTSFVPGLGDVPAMPGLTPAEDEPLLFDKPTGRIAEALLQGRMDRKAVLAFYGQAMPQLGWTRLSDTRYQREGEELRLEFVKGNSGAGGAGPVRTLVRFTLMPR